MEKLQDRVLAILDEVADGKRIAIAARNLIMQAVEEERAELVAEIGNIFACSGCRICPKHFAKLVAAFKAGGGT